MGSAGDTFNVVQHQKVASFTSGIQNKWASGISVSGHQNPPWVRYCLTCGKDRSLIPNCKNNHADDRVLRDNKPTKLG